MEKEKFCAEIMKLEKSLYYTAKAILKNDCDCGDAVQSAVLRAYQKLPKLKNPEYFKTWVTRILMNECYDILRKRKWAEQVELEESVPAYEGTDYSDVYAAICSLNEKYRITFVLYYCEGFSVLEIGRILRISQSAVKTRLYRARKLLQNELKGEYGYENAEYLR